MKKDSGNLLTDEALRQRFGDLGEEDLKALRDRFEEGDLDMDLDADVDSLLRGMNAANPGEAPRLPVDVRARFESARLESENETSDVTVYSTPKRYDPESGDKIKVMSRWHSSAVITGGLAAAAAIVVAYVTYIRPVEVKPVLTYADNVTLLTPGQETGFLEPIFTWKADNGGVIDVKVLNKNGLEVASLDNAFPPLRWSALKSSGDLSSGQTYELELSTPDGVIGERRFATSTEAAGAPDPDETIEAIVEQCQELIAANRPADAWMLWGELTSVQKSDPRMQELKEQILAVITG